MGLHFFGFVSFYETFDTQKEEILKMHNKKSKT